MKSYFLKLFVSAALVTIISTISYAEISTADSGNIEVFTSFGPMLMGQTSAFVTVDSLISDTYGDVQSGGGDQISSSFFEFIEYAVMSSPALLTWKDPDSKYFVVVLPDKVDFQTVYEDLYGLDPSIGFPKAVYWKTNSPQSEVELEKKAAFADGYIYEKKVALDLGIYNYKYCATNDSYPDMYELLTSSFVVTRAPNGFTNKGVADGSIVSNARVPLMWDQGDPVDAPFTYEVWLKEGDLGSWVMIHSGSENSYELTALNYATKYYWKIKSTNKNGAWAWSSEYSFTTINSVDRPFNYPNPFNPNKQKTSIVFNSASAQDVTIKIYSEYGDPVFSATHSAEIGANEFIYDGKDDRGETLYNGSYICRIETNEGAKACYILIIK
ncbi:MAG: hypothetical protein ABH857_00335 [Elusimicrobiota bacterium]